MYKHGQTTVYSSPGGSRVSFPASHRLRPVADDFSEDGEVVHICQRKYTQKSLSEALRGRYLAISRDGEYVAELVCHRSEPARLHHSGIGARWLNNDDGSHPVIVDVFHDGTLIWCQVDDQGYVQFVGSGSTQILERLDQLGGVKPTSRVNIPFGRNYGQNRLEDRYVLADDVFNLRQSSPRSLSLPSFYSDGSFSALDFATEPPFVYYRHPTSDQRNSQVHSFPMHLPRHFCMAWSVVIDQECYMIVKSSSGFSSLEPRIGQSRILDGEVIDVQCSPSKKRALIVLRQKIGLGKTGISIATIEPGGGVRKVHFEERLTCGLPTQDISHHIEALSPSNVRWSPCGEHALVWYLTNDGKSAQAQSAWNVVTTAGDRFETVSSSRVTDALVDDNGLIRAMNFRNDLRGLDTLHVPGKGYSSNMLYCNLAFSKDSERVIYNSVDSRGRIQRKWFSL